MKLLNIYFLSKIAGISVLIGLFGHFSAFSQNSVTGKWKTIDDDTNKPKSIVEITEKNGVLYGRIIKLFRETGEDPDPICDKCPSDDDRHNKKVIGMEIINGLKKDDDEYSGGTILDPADARVYRCKIWLNGNDLMVRGYWGPFYRTQTWKREN
jgi:uncharacterized protein (DUF2147 family)